MSHPRSLGTTSTLAGRGARWVVRISDHPAIAVRHTERTGLRFRDTSELQHTERRHDLRGLRFPAATELDGSVKPRRESSVDALVRAALGFAVHEPAFGFTLNVEPLLVGVDPVRF